MIDVCKTKNFNHKKIRQFLTTEIYLTNLKLKLLKQQKKDVLLTREWARIFPSKPGVYVFYEGRNLVYVGESGNIQKRMMDLLDTRNHVLRRSIGERHFLSEPGYAKADSSHKFPDHIEKKIEDFITRNLKVGILPVDLGRKELEELIQSEFKNTSLYNRRSKRAT